MKRIYKTKSRKRGLMALGDRLDLSGIMTTIEKIDWELLENGTLKIYLGLEADHKRSSMIGAWPDGVRWVERKKTKIKNGK